MKNIFATIAYRTLLIMAVLVFGGLVSPMVYAQTPEALTVIDAKENSLIHLSITDNVDTFEQNAFVSYKVELENISDHTIRDIVLMVKVPSELNFIESDLGSYNPDEHAIFLPDGTFVKGERKEFYVHTQAKPIYENLQATPVVATAQISYQNIESGARETATAYDVDYGYAPKTLIQPIPLEEVIEAEPEPVGLAAMIGSSTVSMNAMIVALLLLLVILEIVLLTREYPHFSYNAQQRKRNGGVVQENKISIGQPFSEMPVESMSSVPRGPVHHPISSFTEDRFAYLGHLGS